MGKRFAVDFERIARVKAADKFLVEDASDGVVKYALVAQLNKVFGEMERSLAASAAVINALAHSDCSLDERVEALENALIAVLSGKVLIPKLQVKQLGVWGDNNLVITGTSAPARQPDRAGQFYIDTDSGAVYKSTGNKAVSDWKPM